MKVAIIGGSGKMGQWFARYLLKEGKEVVIAGRNRERLEQAKRLLGVDGTTSNVDAVKGADVVLLSVPLNSFEGVVREIGSQVGPGQSVIDVTSTKVFPVEVMHRYIRSGVVLGAHPLFGPGAAGVSCQNFVLTPTSPVEEALAGKIRQHLETRGARVTVMTPQEHDETMTVVLGLAHFIALVSAETLVASGKLKQTEGIGGITYKVLLTLVESVISEDPELYASLQMALPNVTGMEKLFLSKAQEWAELIKNKDRDGFVRQMTALRAALEKDNPDFGRAYENMYRLAAGL